MKRIWILLLLVLILSGCSVVPKSSDITPSAIEFTQSVVTITPTPTDMPALPPEVEENSVTPQSVDTPTDQLVINVTAFPDPTGFTWSVLVSGLSQPVDMADAGDGRLLIVERGGLIRLFLEETLTDEPFLDIRDQVASSGNEQGLLGLALDPDFLGNGKFYVNYTGKNGDSVISRFISTPGALNADPESEVRMLTIAQPYANHNGGGLAFGHDGYLYIGLGDGGAGGDPLGNGQSLDTYLGKLLRLNVNVGDTPFALPADNPFIDSELPAIFAYGLRNPWRFSFDRLTGDLFIADVGQNEYEEVNYLHWPYSGGINFGWNYREAAHNFQGTPPDGLVLVDPIWEYEHDQGCSVTGGFVYRGEALPEWQGIYLVGDYCNGRIWGLMQLPGGSWQSQVLFNSLSKNISSFGQDSNGEIYILSINSGEVLRLERN